MTKPLSLLIEDDVLNRKLMQDVLSLLFDVLTAANGEQARASLQMQVPDIVFLDLQLPDVDGFDLLRDFNRRPDLKDVPLVIISAHAMQNSIDRAEQIGCSEYVIKPIMEDPLVFVSRMVTLARHSRRSPGCKASGEITAKPKEKPLPEHQFAEAFCP